ncbi:MAG: hypothetical protein KAQ90_00030 [Melioribacteraceae bacterium]|nr:hypothetical protein [Melioribacteraceae bacterium]
MFVLLFLLQGCFNPFAPTLDENLGADGSFISPQTSIPGLFQNFQYSYTFKDTTIYGFLLNQEYSFIYRDYDIGADVSWGRDDDMKVTYGLFQNTERLDLIWNNIVSMTEDSTNIIRSFNLTVTFNPTDIVFIDGRVNLDLEKNDLGIWKIVNWIDESNF